MSSIIRTINDSNIWDDLRHLDFFLSREPLGRYRDTDTLRYDNKNNKNFCIYVPCFMLIGKSKNMPNQIIISIGQSHAPTETIGFKPQRIVPKVTPNLCEFELEKNMKNSKLYIMTFRNRTYKLYVPNEIFGSFTPPKRLFISITIP
jgi:hypothetical protein